MPKETVVNPSNLLRLWRYPFDRCDFKTAWNFRQVVDYYVNINITDSVANLPHWVRSIGPSPKLDTDRLRTENKVGILSELKLLSVEGILSQETLEGAPLFTGSFRRVGNVAAMFSEEIHQIAALERLHRADLRLPQGLTLK